MKIRTITAAALAAAALLAPAAAEARTCRYADNGRYPEVAKLTASGTTCTVARQVATQVDLEEGAEPRSLSVGGGAFAAATGSSRPTPGLAVTGPTGWSAAPPGGAWWR